MSGKKSGAEESKGKEKTEVLHTVKIRETSEAATLCGCRVMLM